MFANNMSRICKRDCFQLTILQKVWYHKKRKRQAIPAGCGLFRKKLECMHELGSYTHQGVQPTLCNVLISQFTLISSQGWIIQVIEKWLTFIFVIECCLRHKNARQKRDFTKLAVFTSVSQNQPRLAGVHPPNSFYTKRHGIDHKSKRKQLKP